MAERGHVIMWQGRAKKMVKKNSTADDEGGEENAEEKDGIEKPKAKPSEH